MWEKMFELRGLELYSLMTRGLEVSTSGQARDKWHYCSSEFSGYLEIIQEQKPSSIKKLTKERIRERKWYSQINKACEVGQGRTLQSHCDDSHSPWLEGLHTKHFCLERFFGATPICVVWKSAVQFTGYQWQLDLLPFPYTGALSLHKTNGLFSR